MKNYKWNLPIKKDKNGIQTIQNQLFKKMINRNLTLNHLDKKLLILKLHTWCQKQVQMKPSMNPLLNNQMLKMININSMKNIKRKNKRIYRV